MGSNFDNRPFQDIEEMHEGIRKRWNQEVAPKDDVYVLGDLIWNLRNGNREAAKELLDSLNGKLHLILGNHDRTADPLFDECFEEVTPTRDLQSCWTNRNVPSFSAIIICPFMNTTCTERFCFTAIPIEARRPILNVRLPQNCRQRGWLSRFITLAVCIRTSTILREPCSKSWMDMSGGRKNV